MTRKKIYFTLAFLLSAGLIVFCIWYFSSRDKSTGQTAGTTANNSQQNPTQNKTTTFPVNVYFSKHPESDDDPGKTYPLQRLSPDLGVAKYSIQQLLKGPTAAELKQGYFTTARLRSGTSNCGGQDFNLKVAGGVATLQFCLPFDHLGVVADGQADSEIKATLKQFGSVSKVVILNYKGSCEFDLSGQNLCLQQ